VASLANLTSAGPRVVARVIFISACGRIVLNYLQGEQDEQGNRSFPHPSSRLILPTVLISSTLFQFNGNWLVKSTSLYALSIGYNRSFNDYSSLQLRISIFHGLIFAAHRHADLFPFKRCESNVATSNLLILKLSPRSLDRIVAESPDCIFNNEIQFPKLPLLLRP
jgi:hypothetical protein